MKLPETQLIKRVFRCGCVGLGVFCQLSLVAQVTNEVQTESATNTAVTAEVSLQKDPENTSTNIVNPLDFKSYAIVISRNIFSPTKEIPRVRTEVKRVPQIDLISLVGTMSSEKGQVAFFDGTASTFRSAVKLTNVIAGLTLSAISAEQVTLTANGQTFLLRVGNQLRREDQGDWAATDEALPTTSSSPITSGAGSEQTSTVASPGEDNDVLKRLLQKREQELTNEK